jgi:hypothetical protein
MRFCSKPSLFPRLDSALFNAFSLSESANSLASSLQFVLKHELRMRAYRKGSARSAFRILVSVNAFPEDETVSLNRIRHRRIFHDFDSHLLTYLSKRAGTIDFPALATELGRLAGRYRTSLVRRWNRTAIAVVAGDIAPLQNCFILSASSYSVRGFSRGTSPFDRDSLVIPAQRLWGTALEVVCALRHFIVISLAKSSYDFSAVHSVAGELWTAHTSLRGPLERVLELARALAPIEFYWPSIFLPESAIFRDAERFHLPRFPFRRPPEPHTARVPRVHSSEHASGDVRLDVTVTLRSAPSSSTNLLQSPGEHDPEAGEVNDVTILELIAQLRRWRPHHSHQLLLAVGEKQLKRKAFRELPLAANFSFEAAQFALEGLRIVSSCPLFRVRAHIDLEGAPTPRRSPTGRRESSESHHSDRVFEGDCFDYCAELANFARATPARVAYLRLRGLGVLTPLDPDLVRIAPVVRGYMLAIPGIRNSLRHAIVPAVGGNRAEGWLNNCIRKMSDIALMMFLEFVGGKWALTDAKDEDKIGLFFSQQLEAIEAVQAERSILLGIFQSEEALRTKLMQKIQEYTDMKFESLYM